jgi:hypothetical protein
MILLGTMSVDDSERDGPIAWPVVRFDRTPPISAREDLDHHGLAGIEKL